MADLNLSNVDTLVPEAPCSMFYATKGQVYCRFKTDDIAVAIILIWYHIQTNTYSVHTETNRLTHEYIL